jgi:hypothetical protein
VFSNSTQVPRCWVILGVGEDLWAMMTGYHLHLAKYDQNTAAETTVKALVAASYGC